MVMFVKVSPKQVAYYLRIESFLRQLNESFLYLPLPSHYTSFPPSSKFVDDRWMVQYGYLEPGHEAPPGAAWWWNLPVTVLPLQIPLTVNSKVTCSETMEVFHQVKEQQLAITNDNGSVVYNSSEPPEWSQVCLCICLIKSM